MSPLHQNEGWRRAEVPPDLANERLDRVCAALFADLSRGAARRAIDRGGVTIDGRRVRACSRSVPAGAVVTVAPAPASAEETTPLVVVYEDDHLIVVDKPARQLTQPSPLGSAGTLLDAVEQHLRRGRRRPYVGLVHRLDRDASGLVVFARTRSAAASLSDAVRAHTAERRYEALVRGIPAADQGRVDLPLNHDARTNRAFVDRQNGRPAGTRWEVLVRAPSVVPQGARQARATGPGVGIAHVAAWLETGRTHQLRVHLAETFGPIVGDRRYGSVPDESAERRLYLHATNLVVPHPATGERVAFASPVPETFLRRFAFGVTGLA